MARNHPGRDLVNYVVNKFQYGFDLGLTEEPPPRGPCENLSKAHELPHMAQELIDKEIRKETFDAPSTKYAFLPN